MSILYVASCRAGGLEVVKFGITSRETHWPRFREHEQSNPFGTRLKLRAEAVVHVRDDIRAKHIERDMRRASAASFELVSDSSFDDWGKLVTRSGEWVARIPDPREQCTFTQRVLFEIGSWAVPLRPLLQLLIDATQPIELGWS